MLSLVIGSSNTDLVIRSSHLPMPGELYSGVNLINSPVVKANQAIAAKRAGTDVQFDLRSW